MNRVPDRKKQRREYLQKKGKAYSTIAIMSTLLGLTAVTGFLVIALMVLLILFAPRVDSGLRLTAILSIAVLGSGCSLILRWLVRDYRTARRQIAQLPFVPPVTPSTLPVEEVLVRGSVEPDTTPETLLRAAREINETAPDQLLRVVPGAKEAHNRCRSDM